MKPAPPVTMVSGAMREPFRNLNTNEQTTISEASGLGRAEASYKTNAQFDMLFDEIEFLPVADFLGGRWFVERTLSMVATCWDI